MERFLLFNAIGAMLWACAVGTGGYLFGNALEKSIGHIKRYETHTFAAIVVIGVIVWLTYFLFRKRQKTKMF